MDLPPHNETWLIIPPEALCGCESGRQWMGCHMEGGSIKSKPKNINPKPPVSGKSISKCHFAFTNNCGRKISREHVLSRAVLNEISTTGKVTLDDGLTQRTVSLDSDTLITKSLCGRHNEGFGAIDQEAGRLIRAVRKAHEGLSNWGLTGPEQKHFLFDGFDIERWLLKTMLNAARARLSDMPGRIIPIEIKRWFGENLRAPYGLYVRTIGTDPGPLSIRIAREAKLQLIYDGVVLSGISVSLAGLELSFIVQGRSVRSLRFQASHVYRPKALNFFEGRNIVALFFGWSSAGSEILWISRNNPNPKIPTGIIDSSG